MKHRILPVAAGAALVLAACGSSPESGEDATDVTLPDADELIEDAEALGVTPLALAFDQAADASSYRAEIAMGMSMSFGELGAIEFAADPATPMSYIEVDAEGEQYTLVDLAPMMNGMLASSGLGDGGDATEFLGGDLAMETWLSGTTITIDVGGFAPMLQQVPGATPFPAEVFTVDIARLAAGLEAPQVAAAITGQAAPDPVEMATVLRDALADAESVDDDRYAGTLTLQEYSAAFGQDLDSLLGGLGPAAELPGADGAALQQIFDEITVDVEVSLVDGAVDTLRFDLDMTPMIDTLAAEAGAEGQLVAGGTFDVTMLMDFDLDPSIDVIVPDGDFPDGTDQFLDLLAQG